MKKIARLFCIGLLIASCSGKENGGNTPDKVNLEIDFSSDKTEAYTGEEVVFTATAKGGTAPYTFEWDFSDGITKTGESATVVWETAGVKIITLRATDAKGNAALQPKSRTYKVSEAPIEDKGDISILWVKEIPGATGVRSSSPAIDDAGNVYLVANKSDDALLVKVSADGSNVQTASMKPSPGNSDGSPSIDKDGNIYAYGGTSTGGSLHKFTSALAASWAGEFWNKGNAANPKMWYGAPVQINDEVILVANAGSTGTVGAIKKADGTRVSWMLSKEGTGGPSGGCRQSPVVSKDGYLWQVCAANGVAGMEVNALLKPGGTSLDFLAKTLDDETTTLTSAGSDRPAHAVVNVGGTNYCAGYCTPTGSPTQIYILGRKTNEAGGVVDGKVFLIDASNTSILNEKAQDQGATIVGANGEVIVSLKASDSHAVADGGLVAINPATMQLAWEFRISDDAEGAALTKEGNVVFGTDQGSFYIVKPGAGKAELVAKADINALAAEAGLDMSDEKANIKMWSNVTVGDDGTMYIGFQKVGTDENGAGILALKSSAVTGPGTSCWPMYGVDRKHTGVQK